MSNATLWRSTRPAADQVGFSLLELLLATVLTLLLVGLVTAALRGFVARSAATRETRELDERVAWLDAQGQADFDLAGRGLVQTEQFGSGTEPLTFSGNGDYRSEPGRLSRERLSSAAPVLANRVLLAGTGRLAFANDAQNSALQAEVVLASGTRSCGFRVNGERWAIVEDGREVARNPASDPVLRGDVLVIQVENMPDPSGPQTIAYYRQRDGQETLLGRSSQPPPAYPLLPIVNELSAGAILSAITLTGAPLQDRVPTAPRQALLPFDAVSQERLAAPVQVMPEGQGYLIFRADEASEAFHLSQPIFVRGAEVALRLTWPERGDLAEGDYGLLIDFSSQHSALLQVRRAVAEENLLAAAIVSAQAPPAWGRFFSRPEDYEQHEFSVGSVVVKLAPPVVWSVARQGDRLELRRREGVSDETIVDLSLTQFSVQEQVTAEGLGRSYIVAGELQAEAVEAVTHAEDAARRAFSFNYAPRALNRAATPY